MNKKISDFQSIDALNGTDIIPVVRFDLITNSNQNYKIAGSAFTDLTNNIVNNALTNVATSTATLLPTTTFNSYQTNVATSTATLLPTTVYINASGSWQTTYSTVCSLSTNWQTAYSLISGGIPNSSPYNFGNLGSIYPTTGNNNISSSQYSFIAGGSANSTNNQNNVFILGTGLSAYKPNTTYVNNLVSFGSISSTNISTFSLSSRFINLEHSIPNDGINPVLFMGERGDGTGGTVLNSLSGFNTTYDEVANKFIISTQFGSLAPISALIIDSSANVGIGNTNPTYNLDNSGFTRSMGGYFIGNTSIPGTGHYLYDSGNGSVTMRAGSGVNISYYTFTSAGQFQTLNGGAYFNGNVTVNNTLTANNVTVNNVTVNNTLTANNIFGNSTQTVLTDGSSLSGNGPNTLTLNYANGVYINSQNIILSGNVIAPSLITLSMIFGG